VQPDVPGILKKGSKTYKAASQYEFVTDVTTFDPRTKKSTTGHARFAFKSPNRYRVEMDGFSEGMGPFGMGQGLILHDGSTLWFYTAQTNQYGSIPGEKLSPNAPGDLGDVRPGAMDYFMMWRYRGAADSAGDAKLIRQEAIDFDGRKVECYVIGVHPTRVSVPDAVEYTWWIDKNRNRVLREDTDESSAVFRVIRLNEPLSDDLFKFTPAPGTQRIEPRAP
jgi:outer membrane lipoprotein-sorting protein